MTEEEFVEKLRKSKFESVELLSENQKIFDIKAIDLYNDFILVTQTGNFHTGYYLSEIVIILCNNHLDVNLYDTIYNIFLSLTNSMISFREFNLWQMKKKKKKKNIKDR